MRAIKLVVTVVVGLAATAAGLELGERLGVPGVTGVVATAGAVVGRPLTPVSVSGVARRTVRRCAVGAVC